MHSKAMVIKVIVPAIIYALFSHTEICIAQEGHPKQPTPMIYHNLVYHDKLDKILLFGGQSKHGWKADLNDVWMLDPDSFSWTKICKNEAISDSGYAAHSPIYDIESNQIILYNQIGETWSFHVESKEWVNRKPHNSPSPRCGHNMVYNIESDKAILFGGFECTGVNDPVFNDTWAYDYNTNTWAELKAFNRPPSRMYASMIYNSIEDKVILWGGRVWEPLNDNSIWEFDLGDKNWAEIINGEGPETAYAYPAMVHITSNNRLFLFGGGKLESTFVGTPVNEAWIFDCETRKWIEVDTKNTPPPVTVHSMLYLPKANDIVLFGGETESMYSNNIIEGIWVLSIKDLTWDKK